jgi:hypothetical protein
MSTFLIKTMALAGLAAFAFLPGAKADQQNQKTVFTFSGPVEVPGQVLPAGTYVFKLANTHSRHLVQVFSKDETRLVSTFIAIPNYRLNASDQTIIKFDERAAGSPQAIKEWFYPGRNHGHEFVYPKTEAITLAKANNTPVPFMPNDLAPDTLTQDANLNGPGVEALNAAPVMAETPNGSEVEIGTVFMVTAGHGDGPAELPAELPTTATSLPLMVLIGSLSLFGAVGLRIAAPRKG